MAYGPFAENRAFAAWLAEREKLADPFCYAICDKAGRALGLASLMSSRPDMRVIEVGHIIFRRRCSARRSPPRRSFCSRATASRRSATAATNGNATRSMRPSRRAALRLGFAFEGIFRNHMIVKGRNRDTAWFAMTDGDWPARKAAFERWLAPANFDADGRQKTRLSELNKAP